MKLNAVNAAGTAAADTALAADPDRDGPSNLAEFALLLPPLHPDTHPLKLLPTAPGSPIKISLAVPNDIPALRARLHVSTDWEDWDASGAFIQRWSETPTPDGTIIITARLIGPNLSPRAFVRLAIDL